MERTTVRVEVARYNEYEWSMPFAEFMEKMTDMLMSVPEQYRDSLKIGHDKESDYDGGYYYFFTVEYQRPETDQELSDRLAESKRWNARAEANERAVYERLKAKFG